MRAFVLLLSSALSLSLIACGGSGSGDQQNASSTNAGGTTATTAGVFSGTVKETVDAGGYTYALVDNGSESVWAAARQMELPVGTEVSFSTQMPMQNWHSDTLDRTWDLVYFTGAFEKNDGHAHDGESGHADPHAGMDMGKMGGAGHGSTPTGGATTVEPGSIEMAEGGLRIAELWTDKADLAGDRVKVRGQVVKFNGGIMGRNWLHLQDGSGAAGAGTNDLTVTTDSKAAVGDIVTVTGTVVLDKDFGSGYRYQLLLEDATVEVESTSAGTN